MGVGISTKMLAVFIIVILTSSSFQANFLNLQKSNDTIPAAFAQTAPAANINQIGNYAAFALHNAVIANNVTFNTGSLGAQNAQSNMALPSNAEIIIKQNSKFNDPTSAVVGDSVIINSGTTIQNVFYNELQNSGTVVGTQNTPLALPVVNSLPPFPRSTPGTASVDVPMDSSVTLQPGQYGSITVEQGGAINFVGGIYNVTSITAKQNSNLTFNSPSQVVVQDQITWNKGVFVGPSSGSGLHSHDIVIYVGGNSTINQNTTSTDFGKDATVDVNMYAPTGSIEMDQGTNATGAFIADTVTVQQDSVINLDSAFGSKITWMPSSLSVQAKPFAPLLLNFTSATPLQNANVVVSSQLDNIVIPLQSVIPTISSNGVQTLPVTISIPPTVTSGWHNGTITFSSNGVLLANSLNLNVLVPQITTETIQTPNGNITKVATPSFSPFFKNTYDVTVYFTFANGTITPIHTYYDIFANSGTTPVSYHQTGSSSVVEAIYHYMGLITTIFANLWSTHQAAASSPPVFTSANCTNYSMTYHFNNFPSTVTNDLSVAANALNVNATHSLIIRNDISWADVDKGAFNSTTGDWVASYDDTVIDNYFNNVITPGKVAYVILGVHSPPEAIAEKGTAIPGQPYAQYLYKNQANAFIQHTMNHIKAMGWLDRVAYWQIDNEPTSHPIISSIGFSTNTLVKFNVDWPTTVSALNFWASTVKSIDPSKPVVINVYQASPSDIVPQDLQNGGVIFSILPFVNLLNSSQPVGQQLGANIGIMGFDIYPDQFANFTEPNPITNGFNEALSQANTQFTLAQNNFAFNGRWGIVEMASGPKAAFLPPIVPYITQNATAQDVSNMINIAKSTQFNGQPPALIGLFQLRALDTGLDAAFAPFNDAYGLINNGSGKTYTDFLNATKSSIVQNCPPPPPAQLTVIKKIINTGGGTLTISGVTLQINGTTVTNGTANTLPAGKYKVSENPVAGYIGTISGDCASDGTIALNPGEAKTCIITNTFNTGPVFFDNFDDGPPTSTGWSQSLCQLNSSTEVCSIGQVSASRQGVPAPSPPYWGFVQVNVTNGAAGPIQVRYAKNFTTSIAGNYNMSAYLGTTACDGCTMSSQLFLDGKLVFDADGTQLLPVLITRPKIVFDQTIVNLQPGQHTMEMGMFSNFAGNGIFQADFDNVKVQSTSTTTSLSSPVTGGPYFNVTLGQQSANATRPANVTVPLYVNWYQGWNPQPVSIFFGNLTNTNISTSITSIGNTTSYQEFNVTFNVPTTVLAGNYTVPIMVWQTGTDDEIVMPFNLHVK